MATAELVAMSKLNEMEAELLVNTPQKKFTTPQYKNNLELSRNERLKNILGIRNKWLRSK